MEVYESALILPARGLPTKLETLRLQYDAVASAGIETHVTVTIPFLPRAEINSKTDALLRQATRSVAPFTSEFVVVRTFPAAVYLAPEDPTPFHALLESVLRMWPGYPPHGGRYGAYVPHLTIANEVGGPKQAELIERIEPLLPFGIYFNELHLAVRVEGGWRRTVYRLGPPPGRG